MRGIALALALPCLAVPPASAEIRLFGGERAEGPPTLSPTSDGGALLSGTSLAWGNGALTDAWVLRLGPDLEPRWDRVIAGIDDEDAFGAIELPSGDVLVAGMTRSEPTPRTFSNFVATLDADGGTRTIDLEGNPSPVTMARGRPPGRSLAAIADWSYNAASLQRLGPAGVPAWSSGLPRDGSESYFRPHGLSVAADGGIAWSGTLEYLHFAASERLGRVRADGVALWAARTGSAPNGMVVAAMDDGTTWAAAGADVVHLDATGGVIASGRLSSPDGDVVAGAVAAIDAGSVLWGGHVATPGGQQALALRLEPGPVVTWARAWLRPGTDASFTQAIESDDGRPLLAGTVRGLSGPGRDAEWLVVRLDAAGDAGDPCGAWSASPVTIGGTVDWALAPDVLGAASAGGRWLTPTDLPVRDGAVRALPPPCAPCPDDPHEWDDACGRVERPLRSGQPPQHRDSCDGSEDWAPVPVVAGSTYAIAAADVGAGADADVSLWADDCATLLVEDAAGAPGTGSSVTWTAVSSGIVHVRVRHGSGAPATDSAYELSIASDDFGCGSWSRAWRAHRPAGRPGVQSSGLGAVTPSRDGGFVAVADDVVLRLDASGSTRWERRIELADGSFVHLENVVEVLDGRLLASGIVLGVDQRHALLELEPEGALVQAWIAPRIVHDLFARPDGGATIVLSDQPPPFTQGACIQDWSPVTGPGIQRCLDRPWYARHAAAIDGDVIVAGSATFDHATLAVVRHDPTTGATTCVDLAHPGFGYAGVSGLAMRAGGRVFVQSSDRVVALSPNDAVEWALDFDGTSVPRGLGNLAATQGGLLMTWPTTSNATALLELDAAGVPLWSEEAPFGLGAAVVSRALDATMLVGGRRTNEAVPSGAPKFPWLARIQPSDAGLPGCGGLPLPLPVATPFAVAATPAPIVATVTPSAFVSLAASTSPRAIVRVEEPCPCTPEPFGPPPPISGPGSAFPVEVTGEGTLTWEPPELSGSQSFNVHRGSLAGLGSGAPATCLFSGLTEPEAEDSGAALAGGSYYLVSGVNAHGEGSAGSGSTGAETPVARDCP